MNKGRITILALCTAIAGCLLVLFDPLKIVDPSNLNPLDSQPYLIIGDQKIRHVRVEGVELYIPDTYKLGEYDSQNVDQHAVALQILLPNLEPRMDENMKFFTEGLGWGRRGTILLADHTQKVGLKHTYDLYQKWHPSYEDQGILFGLKHLRPKHRSDGLGSLHSEMYVEEHDETLQSFIACQPYVKNPGCSHIFMDGPIYVEFSYGITFLHEWRELSSKVKRLLEHFKQKPLEGEPI